MLQYNVRLKLILFALGDSVQLITILRFAYQYNYP